MIVANDIDSLYKLAITEVLHHGKEYTTRGLTFKELRFQQLVLLNPRARMIQNKTRKFSSKFMAAEFIWMMNGHDELESITPYNKRMANFSDDGVVLHGAYGPRLRNWVGFDQVTNVVNQLKADNNTRQAVIIILDPVIDLAEKTKDIPCNDLLQFIHRDGELHMSCYVRSNDLNWGFPYDVFHWTMLQEMIATELGFDVGEYNHFIGSMHIYDKDYDAMAKVAVDTTSHVPMLPMPPGNVIDTVNRLGDFEDTYRTTGEVDFHGLSYWWQGIANQIISVEE